MTSRKPAPLDADPAAATAASSESSAVTSARRGCVLLAGGGTGGHVFPLIAIAETLRRVAPHVDIRFVGSARGLEARIVPEHGFTLETLPAEPLKGQSLLGMFRGLSVAATSVIRGALVVARLRPSVVLSVGGFAAGPVAMAAALTGIPLALLEPNRTPGLTQRLLMPLARRVYASFPETAAELGSKARILGTPLREGFVPKACPPALPSEPLNVLVMGGSQGADFLNRTVPSALALVSARVPLRVLHQAGRGRGDAVRAMYLHAMKERDGELGSHGPAADAESRTVVPPPAFVSLDVEEFIDDVPARLTAAHVVISRAGALTCAELCAIGRAAILIPFPHAADDHQRANAQALAKAGGAVMLEQKGASVHAIAAALQHLLTHHAARRAMAETARARGVDGASERITRDLLELAGMGAGMSPSTEAPGGTGPLDPGPGDTPSSKPLSRGSQMAGTSTTLRTGAL